MNRNFLFGLIGLLLVALVGGYFILQRGGGGTADTVSETTSAASTQNQQQGGNAGGAQSNGDDFTFSWSEFPEFRPVFQSRNREEYLTPHNTDIAYGNPNAPVKIVEFFSYACQFCKSFHEGSYQQVLADYVDTGLVQFVKRDFLLNSQVIGFELRAGAGAQCFAESAQSQHFSDLVFAQQRTLANAPNPVEALVPVFVASGMEETMARSCMGNKKNLSLVFGRSIKAGEIADVQSTPTLFINGEKYQGSTNDYRSLASEIERAIAAAAN